MRPLLLIQTGEAPDPIHARFGGFVDWFRAAMRLDSTQMQVARVDEGAPLPAPESIAGAVITGSGAMVTDRADWSERTAAWIRMAMDANLPLFGVCYGHQLMAHAMGGEVGWLPAGREIGTRVITRTHADTADGAWLDGLPTAFPAHTTHRQSVLQPPPGAAVLARSELDPYQLLRYAPNALSTQFHPEFTAESMRAYLDARAAALREEGLDPVAISADVRPTEAARALLENFARAALRHVTGAPVASTS
ncbi:MAG: glutamine amidotransferase [Proteobacteria bacterium]|nr:glutamine amidotransferase [Pseudomonadota bacterium]